MIREGKYRRKIVFFCENVLVKKDNSKAVGNISNTDIGKFIFSTTFGKLNSNAVVYSKYESDDHSSNNLRFNMIRNGARFIFIDDPM